MRDWEDEHDDPNTEPYTVIHIRRAGEVLWHFVKGAWPDENGTDTRLLMENAPPGTYQFHVFYRTYTKRTWFGVEGRDELEAFMKASKQLAKNKAAADRRRAKRK